MIPTERLTSFQHATMNTSENHVLMGTRTEVHFLLCAVLMEDLQS